MHDQGFYTGRHRPQASSPPHKVKPLSDNSGLVWADGPFPHLRFADLNGYDAFSHGVFTRLGGGSGPPYDSLNTSYTVGDRPVCVDDNLIRIEKAIGAGPLLFLNQVHEDDFLVIGGERAPIPKTIRRADALMTDRPGFPLMIKLADCQSVILYDPVQGAVANVHCGWRGHVKNILAKTVDGMAAGFGCRASDIVAAVSPSLGGPCCAEFTTHEEIFPVHFKEHMVRKDYFDLWDLSRRQLIEAGVKDVNIHISGICTRCRTDLFFSHRAEGLTGRFCTVAMLVDEGKRSRKSEVGSQKSAPPLAEGTAPPKDGGISATLRQV
ncbi:MAG: laccase domain-containing protein [Deltaproteobacteria bacterium]|nr:laccase domain-containing protein [Deltaproteobacteria bacterium]